MVVSKEEGYTNKKINGQTIEQIQNFKQLGLTTVNKGGQMKTITVCYSQPIDYTMH